MSATVISIAQLKGGEGKTTTTGAFGAALSRLGFRVLMLDADPQTNLTHGMGFQDVAGATMYEAMRGEVALADIVQSRGTYGLAPASLSLSGAEVELSTRMGRERLLEGLIRPVKEVCDFILIDCPPSIGLMTVNALAASDYVLVPMQTERHSLKGLQEINRIIALVKENQINPGLSMIGILLNKYDKRKILHRNIFEAIEQQFPGQMFQSFIRTNIALAEAQIMGQDIFEYDAESNGAQDYAALTQEVLNRLNVSVPATAN